MWPLFVVRCTIMDLTISTVRWRTATVVAGLLLACALGMMTGGVLAQANVPHEPNDNRSGATPIDDGQVNGTLSSGNDTDWYSFEATEGEVATFVVTKPISNSTGLYVQTYPPDSDVSLDYFIQSEYDRRDQNSFFPEQSGTYYIKVTAMYEGTNESIPYTVRLPDVPFWPSASKTASGVPHETEPNDHGLTATLIESTQIAGEISVNGDSDWYGINATEGERLSLSLVKPANKSELGIELYAPNGTEVANDTAYEGTKKASPQTQSHSRPPCAERNGDSHGYHIQRSIERSRSGHCKSIEQIRRRSRRSEGVQF